MNNIFIYWFKPKNGRANFGDEIGPFIVSKLSGLKSIFINPNKKKIRRELMKSIFKNQNNYAIKDLIKILIGKKRILVSAGSILNHYNLKNCDIWGSGIIKQDEKVHDAKFYALRGKYSQIRLGELGYDVPDAIGDPALLLPIILPAKNTKQYKLGIIPHYIHYKEVMAMFKNDNILIINLLDSIENVVEKISLCEATISSSLHGIIVSHAYNVTSLWYNLDKKSLFGDDIKFDDYFSSVGIKEYKPFHLPEKEDINELIDAIVINVKSDNSINNIQSNLKLIQKKLINSAPFSVMDEFTNL